jgi:hypothetical protein
MGFVTPERSMQQSVEMRHNNGLLGWLCQLVARKECESSEEKIKKDKT